jgi:hypothetical protein
MSKAITERPEAGAPAGGWRPLREAAPSVMREEEPTAARVVGFIGLMLVALGGVALLLNAVGWASRIGTGPGSFLAIAGLACLLFHAARDADLQIRRTYGVIGLLWLVAAITVTVWPVGGRVGVLFLPWGFICPTLALFFLLPFARNETDATWRQRAVFLMGAVGVALALTGLVGGSISAEKFLMPYGILLALLGLGYLWGFIGLQGSASDLGYRAAQLVAAVGFLVFVVAMVRGAWPALARTFPRWGFHPEPYMVPSGLLLMGLGILYLALAAGLVSDNRLIVLTRRELAAFFYSPIAYIVIFGLTIVGWLMFAQFVLFLVPGPFEERQAIPEPVIFNFIISWCPC